MMDSSDRNYNIMCLCLSGCFQGKLNAEKSDYLHRACPYPNMK